MGEFRLDSSRSLRLIASTGFTTPSISTYWWPSFSGCPCLQLFAVYAGIQHAISDQRRSIRLQLAIGISFPAGDQLISWTLRLNRIGAADSTGRFQRQ